jgi:hypothetical protein
MVTSAVRSHRILVSSSRSASGVAWNVVIAGMRDAIFTGAGAKDRAIDCALRRAEELRNGGSARVVIEPCGAAARHARPMRTMDERLAS